MIKYIKRKDIDINKYDACIENSIQSRVYAYSWYLDIVADNWDVLVLNDYEAVMPIPWKQKYFIKYITQPYFCQQLNVYSEEDLKNEVFRDFFNHIPKHFFLIDINLGFKIDIYVTKKQNFTLSLGADYASIYQNYRKDRKKSLRKAAQGNLKFVDFDTKETLINLYKNVFNFLDMSEKYFNTINKVMEYCLTNGKGFIRNIFLNEELLCSGFFLKYNNKIYYLFAASSKNGKQYGATTYLLDSVIKEYSETNYILDLEGSSIPSIANFYKSFGSDLNHYYNYKSNVVKRIFL